MNIRKQTMLFAYNKNMIVTKHLITFIVNEYFTPVSLREVADITREVIACFKETEASPV